MLANSLMSYLSMTMASEAKCKTHEHTMYLNKYQRMCQNFQGNLTKTNRSWCVMAKKGDIECKLQMEMIEIEWERFHA